MQSGYFLSGDRDRFLGGFRVYLCLCWGVGASWLAAEQRLAVHLGLEAGDVAAAEIFTQVIYLLQLQQVNA